MVEEGGVTQRSYEEFKGEIKFSRETVDEEGRSQGEMEKGRSEIVTEIETLGQDEGGGR